MEPTETSYEEKEFLYEILEQCAVDYFEQGYIKLVPGFSKAARMDMFLKLIDRNDLSFMLATELKRRGIKLG